MSDEPDAVLVRRRMMRDAEQAAEHGLGASHAMLVFLLDRIAQYQEELAAIRGSEEWALASIERRPLKIGRRRQR